MRFNRLNRYFPALAAFGLLGVLGPVHAVDLTTPVKFGLKGSKLTADVSDFPVLLVLNRQRAANLAILQPLQVRIRDDAGTELPFQIERWDPTGNTVIWVKTTVRAGTDEQFLTFDGLGTTPTATAAALIGQSVWSNNFQAVLHLDGSKVDATGRWTLTPSTSIATTADAPCGLATAFNGGSTVLTTNITEGGDLRTWSFWVKYQGGNTCPRIWEKNITGSSVPDANSYVDVYTCPSQIGFCETVSGGVQNSWSASKLPSAGWAHVIQVDDRQDPNALPMMYVNGEAVALHRPRGLLNAGTTQANSVYMLGNSLAKNRGLIGAIDEWRVANVIRSPAWIKAEFLSSSDQLVDYAGKTLSLPETITSRTSPAWVQGKLDDEATDLKATINTVQTPAWSLGGSQCAFGSQTQTLGVTLRPGANTLTAQAKLKDGTPVAAESSIDWIPTVLGATETPNEIILRKGESLRLDLNATATSDVAYDLNGDLAQDITGKVGTPVLATFNTVGTFTVSGGTDRNNDGNIDLYSESQGSITVHVISADLPALPCEIDFTRDLAVPISAPTAVKNQISLQSSSNNGAIISGVTSTTTGLKAKLTARNFGKTSIVTRLGVDGPVLSLGQVQAFTMRTSAEEYIGVVEEYPNNSFLVEATLTCTPIIRDLDVLLHVIVKGVTFEDSTLDWQRSTNSFTLQTDGTAKIPYRLIMMDGIKTGPCHNITVKYQGILVGGK